MDELAELLESEAVEAVLTVPRSNTRLPAAPEMEASVLSELETLPQQSAPAPEYFGEQTLMECLAELDKLHVPQ